MEENIINTIKEIITDKTGIETDVLNPIMRIQEDLGIDKYDITEISISIEDKFSIQIDDDDVMKIKTIGEYINMVIREISKS